VEGTVKLAFDIAIDGSTVNVRVENSSGNSDLDATAIECAKEWRYRPATKGGVPVQVPWSATVNFALPNRH